MRQQFGATKFRNAVPAVPPRDAWYRSHLPAASDAPQNTVAYSSVVKTNRQHVITVTPSGDVSIRDYDSVGEKEGEAWNGKIGPVADWDLSRLEGADMVVAGTDGTVSSSDSYGTDTQVTYSTVRSLGAPEQQSTFKAPARVTSIALHPTTRGIALACSTAAEIYDLNSGTAVISLKVPDNQPLWSAAWKGDGRLVAGVSKKGQMYVWDPRSGADPVQKRDLATVLQALKPVRVAWAGDEVFVTSFSRTRARQYSLFKPDLSTVFTASVDNSQGPLSPLVDEERRIVFLVGRGDMTLRQIELSGPQGYQEVTHPLQYAVTSGSLAGAHWSTLPVMEARVASIILPIVDKDGETLMPVHINVPRRQLIDYHADLYPDVVGAVPEQDTKAWFEGGDSAPLSVSLDPTRRGEWEKRLASYSPAAPSSTTKSSAQPPPEPSPNMARPDQEDPARAVSPEPSPEPKQQPTPAPAAAAAITSASQPKSASETKPSTSSDDLPKPQNGEDYASTSYKVRNVGEQLEQFRKEHVKDHKGPLMVGLQGPQGCGKTTLCDALLQHLRDKGLKVAVLSLDDLYRTHDGLKKVAGDHPNNPLLAGRGPPGTHDMELASSVLDNIMHINEGNGHVELPVFDKSLCEGEGDRSEKTVPVDGPLDVFVLEGWSMGFGPLTPSALKQRYEKKDGKYFPKHSLESLTDLNESLVEVSQKMYPHFSVLVQVEPTSYDYVFDWRLQQEHNMKKANGGKGMTDEQVQKFVERYMPEYEVWGETVLAKDAPWAGHVVRLTFGKDREVLKLETPRSDKPPMFSTSKDNKTPAPTEETAETETSNTASGSETKSGFKPQKLGSLNEAPLSRTMPHGEQPSRGIPGARESTLAGVIPDEKPTSVDKPRYNPSWSRKFMGARSPLNPTYDQLPSIATLHQDSCVLHITNRLALFPIQGPGGRVCVHPLAQKGRVPDGGKGFLSGGAGLTDFAAFSGADEDTVVLAGDDGALRVWKVGKDGIEGPGPEPEQTIKANMDKIAHVAFHPTAWNLVVVASNDLKSPALHFFDISEGQHQLHVPLDVGQIFTFAISQTGSKVALSCKDSQVVVLDPRKPEKQVKGKAHDSPRSFQLAWVDDTHLVSVGFNRGSMRKINLYEVTDNEVKTLASCTIDVSPSVLFPAYDPDTNILYVWGKGERAIQAFEIQPGAVEPIAKLPAFTGAAPQLAVAFFPKTACDVRKVEVARALRLTAKTLEDVTFTIPRNKPQFFQDDVYVDTIDPTPVTLAEQWLCGDDTPPKRRSLRPDGMQPLSEAPAPAVVKKRFVPAAQVMSEEEKKQKEMDALFARAQADQSDSDDEPEVKGLPPPDDDW